MRKNKIFLIIPIVLIIAVASAAIIYYLGYYTSTKQVYKRLIEVSLDSCVDIVDKLEFNIQKSNILLDMNLETNNEKVDSKIVDLVNNSDINIMSQINKENEQLNLDLEIDYNKEDLLNLKTCVEVDNRQTYICLKDFLNKYIKIDVNEKFYTTLDKLLNIDEEETKNNIDKFKNELVNIVKPEHCSSNKEEVVLDGNLKRVTKDTLRLKLTEVIDVLKTVYEDIEYNGETSNYDNAEVEFNIYTTGILKNNIEKIEINIYNLEESLKISIIENVYYYELTNEESTLKGNIKFQKENNNKGTAEIVLEEDFGKLTLKLDYIQEYNTETEVVDISNNTDITNLSKDEQIILLENFEKSKLYSLITKLIAK